MSKLPALLAAVIGLSLLIAGCGKAVDDNAGKGPTPAVQGVDADGTMHPGASDRCPVCGMTVHDRKFPASLTLKDGRTFYFCGPGCLIRTWTDPATHLGVSADALLAARATDYFTGKSLDANEAFWIFGSDVKGPMGPMPVAVSDEAEAETFKKRHGAKTTFRLKDMTAEKWQALRASAAP